MVREAYSGNHITGVDAKNRVSIPADFRDVIQRNSDRRTLLIAEHEQDPCLVLSDLAYHEALRARANSEFGEGYSAAKQGFKSAFFSAFERLGFDETGRITLDPFMRDYARLDRYAVFLGRDEDFEMWDPWLAKEIRGRDDPRLCRRIDARLLSKNLPLDRPTGPV